MSEACSVRDRLKPLATRLLGDYEIYWIFRWRADVPAPASMPAAPCALTEVDEPAVQALPSPLLRAQAWYAGDGARAFLATRRGEPIGLCFYWFGARYQTRNFWPLQPGEAKLVQVLVEPAYRGHGMAACLIAGSAAALAKTGFHALYARVWHSNAASIGAFRRADWRRIALVVTAVPPGMRRPLRLQLPWREG